MSDLLACLSWYLAVSLAGLLALPLAFRLFRLLPDRGYALARPLGLLAAGYVFWMLGSLGFLRNDAGSVLIAAALVLAAGLAWLGRAGLGELRDWLRGHWAYALGVEALFLAAFAGWTWVRAYNPEILGTEKPMEFMFINAILRSPAFPPNDAWLSGHAISYYYFGYVIIAALIRVTGVAPAVAFNLGLALLFALAVTGALGVAVNLIALVEAKDGGRKTEAAHPGPSASLLRRAFWPALLAPLMVVLAGNFYGLLGLLHANGRLADVAVPAVRYDFGDLNAGVPPGVRAGLVNVWDWLDLKFLQRPLPAPRDDFDWTLGAWFFGARVTHDRNLVGQETEAITEMPAFSFILGDLHPHVLGLPFVFIAIALGLHWLLWARGLPSPVPRLEAVSASRFWRLETAEWGFSLRSLLPDLAASAWLLGALGFLNTWDFPIYLFVVVAALALGLGLAWGWGGLLRRWTLVAGFAAGLAVPGFLLYLPFYLTFQSQAGGLLPNLIWPTRFQQSVVMFAHVLIVSLLFLGWLTVRGRAALDRRAALWAGGGLVVFLALVVTAMVLGVFFSPGLAGLVDQFIAPFSRAEALSLILQRRLVDSFATLVPALMIGLSVGLAVGALISSPTPDPAPLSTVGDREAGDGVAEAAPQPNAGAGGEVFLRSPALLFSLILLLTGALLFIGPEFLYLRDNFGWRMNTIFKFYFQAWVLWGLAGAFGLWVIWRQARPAVRVGVWAVAAVAIFVSLIYTYSALLGKTGDFANTPTLDGMAWYARARPNDWAAIRWLNENAVGQPVVAEAIGGSYTDYGRIAMGTGLPTVMGWDGHEGQWRGPYYGQVGGRVGDIEQLYQTRDWTAALAILDRYNIRYVVVGDLERQKYRGVYEFKFEQFMRPVFQSGDVTIYERFGGN